MKVELGEIFRLLDNEIKSHELMSAFGEIIPHFTELSDGGVIALNHFKGKLEKEFGLVNEVEEVEVDGK